MTRDHDPIQVSYATLDSFRRQLTDLALALENTVDGVRRSVGEVVDGAGEVSDDVQVGAAGFELSWQTALQVMSSGAALVGNNIGRLELDLTAMDVQYSGDIRL
jgi:hypothetical protein